MNMNTHYIAHAHIHTNTDEIIRDTIDTQHTNHNVSFRFFFIDSF